MERINIGNIANNGTGDTLRDAFIKVNNNFTSTQDQINNVVSLTAENIGTIGEGIFLTNVNNKLQFKKITSTDIISTDFTDSTLNNISSISTTGNISAGDAFIGNLIGNVVGNVVGNIQGDVVGKVDGIAIQEFYNQFLQFDFGGIGLYNFTNPVSFILSQISMDFGTITSPATIGIDAGMFI
jgi:hypothetical protein